MELGHLISRSSLGFLKVTVSVGGISYRLMSGSMNISRIFDIYEPQTDKSIKFGTYKKLHFLIKPIIHDQTVCHAYSMWFHGVSGLVGKIANIVIVDVSNVLLRTTSTASHRIIEWCK